MSFLEDVQGYSSYAEFPIPVDASDSVEFQLSFSTTNLLQTSLLVFMGQEGSWTSLGGVKRQNASLPSDVEARRESYHILPRYLLFIRRGFMYLLRKD